MNDLKIQVGIMIGGKSVEHDISLISGLQSYFAINKEKYDVAIIYLDKHNHFYTGEKYTDINTYKENRIDPKDEIYFYYATKYGERYHPDRNCMTLARSTNVIKITVKEAESLGLTVCAVCGK